MEDQTIIIKTVVEQVKVSDLTQREKQIYEAGYAKGEYDRLYSRWIVLVLLAVIFGYLIINILL